MLQRSRLTDVLGLLCLASCGPLPSQDFAPGDEEPWEVSAELEVLCEEDLQITREQCAQVAALALPETLPQARGNRYADLEEVAMLGFRLFFDERASGIKNTRCATCH